MGFGAPRDGAARALLGVALTIQLLPLITAVIGASAILTLAMNDNLEFLEDSSLLVVLCGPWRSFSP